MFVCVCFFSVSCCCSAFKRQLEKATEEEEAARVSSMVEAERAAEAQRKVEAEAAAVKAVEKVRFVFET